MEIIINSITTKSFSEPYGAFSLSTKLPDAASAQAKCVAERFITILSISESPPISQASELVFQNNLELLKTLLTSETIDDLYDGRLEKTSFCVVGEGEHNRVWGHPSLNIVLKPMNQKAAENQLRVAKHAFEVTQELNNCWVRIPRTSAIRTGKIDYSGERTIYIEESLPLSLSPAQHEEFWARILTHYESSECTELFKSNLHTLVDQIQLMIERVGYWDIGNKNLPEVSIDGTGVCGTDFENINLDHEDMRCEGFGRLATLLPVAPLFNGIVKRYEQEMPRMLANELEQHEKFVKRYASNSPEPTLEQISQKFHSGLESERSNLRALQDAIRIYDARGYVSGDEEIFSCCDLSAFSTDEQKLAQQLLSDIRNQSSETRNENIPITQKRSVYIQPGCDRDYTAPRLGLFLYTRERFLKVLAVLKDQNVIVSWSDNSQCITNDSDTDSTAYTIRF